MAKWGPEHCNQCRYSESLCGACFRQMIAESTDRRCEGGAVDSLGECFACDAIQGEACRKPKVKESN